MAEKNLIDRMEIHENCLKVYACRKFKKQYLLDDFFAEYDNDIDLSRIEQSILIIPFVLNVIPIIWLSGEKYHIESLDQDLVISLNRVREAFQDMYPSLEWNGELIPDQVVSRNHGRESPGAPDDDSVGVLFSGGVDSICTSFRHMDKHQMLITVWGANIALENTTGWAIIREQAKKFGNIYGKNCTFIKSNFQRFLYTAKIKTFSERIPNWWTHIQHGLGFAGLAAPVLTARGCTKLYIASTHSKDFKGEWGSDYSIDNKLNWAGKTLIHDGAELSRQDKLRSIINFCEEQQKPTPSLKVCFLSETCTRGDNCCKCEKCLRTITGLLLEGVSIQDYGFDTSVQKALELIREKFDTGLMPIDTNAAFFWKELQARTREILAHIKIKYSIRDDCVPFFQWLSSFDLNEYQLRYQVISQPNYVIKTVVLIVKAILRRAPIIDRPLQKKIAQYRYRTASR